MDLSRNRKGPNTQSIKVIFLILYLIFDWQRCILYLLALKLGECQEVKRGILYTIYIILHYTERGNITWQRNNLKQNPRDCWT